MVFRFLALMRAKPSIVGVGYCLVKYNLFIYYMRTYSRHRGVRVGQRQEKKLHGENKKLGNPPEWRKGDVRTELQVKKENLGQSTRI